MMEYQHQPKMNNYSQINPYYLIYCNMNIKIHEQMTKENAQNVVRQIGYLHNAMGFVFKDMIKILSFKFPQVSSGGSNIPTASKASPYVIRPPLVTNNRQAMDIELDEKQPLSKPQKPKQKQFVQQKMSVPFPFRRQQFQKVDNTNKQQSKPPNSNIFDEFAYSKEKPIQPKNKDLNSIKLGVARIIEGVKKKKGEGKASDREKSQKEMNMERPKKSSSNQRVAHDKNERRIISNEPEPNPMKELFEKSIEQVQNQEPDIFNEFVFQSNPSPCPQQPQKQAQVPQSSSQHLQRNEQEEESRLWQFLKQKEEPPIYEISDDEDG